MRGAITLPRLPLTILLGILALYLSDAAVIHVG